MDQKQKDFLNWHANWLKANQTEHTNQPDVLQLVAVLQILGYNIKFFDLHDVQDIAPLQHGDAVLKVMITCGHSGLRCILETKSECQCPKNVAEAIKWEITGTGPNSTKTIIQETGSDLLLPIPKNTQYVIKGIMNQLCQMVSSPRDLNQNSTGTPSKYMAKSPYLDKPLMSPTRYRSLDTLAGSVDLLDTGILKRSTPTKVSYPSLTISSPNLSSMTPSRTSSPVDASEYSNVGYTKLKRALALLTDVAKIFEQKQENSSLDFNVSKIKNSTESLPTSESSTNNMYLNSLGKRGTGSSPNILTPSKMSSVKPMCRPLIRSLTGAKSFSNSSNLVKPTLSIKTVSALPCSTNTSANTLLKRTRIVNSTTIVKNLKYSHVKSTIPKSLPKK